MLSFASLNVGWDEPANPSNNRWGGAGTVTAVDHQLPDLDFRDILCLVASIQMYIGLSVFMVLVGAISWAWLRREYPQPPFAIASANVSNTWCYLMEQVYIMLGLIGVVGIGIFAIAWYQEYGTLEHYVPKRWRKRHGD